MHAFRALWAHALASRQEREDRVAEALKTVRAKRALALAFGVWRECTKQEREAKALQQERRNRRDKMDALLVKMQSGASKVQEMREEAIVAAASIGEQGPGGRVAGEAVSHSSSLPGAFHVSCQHFVCPVPMHSDDGHQESCQIQTDGDAQKKLATLESSRQSAVDQAQGTPYDNENHLRMIAEASHTGGEAGSHHANASAMEGHHEQSSHMPNHEEYSEQSLQSNELVAKSSSQPEEDSCTEDDSGTHLCDAEEICAAPTSVMPYVARPGLRADGSCIRPSSTRPAMRGVANNVVEECAVVAAMRERERQRKERRQVPSHVH
jgi:hypothetical protein